MSRIMVTGGAGYVGSTCVARLLEAGEEVTVYDDLSTGHREAVPQGAELVVAGLGDEDALKRTLARKAYDAVFHFAARSLVGESMQDPLRYLGDTMTHGTKLLRAMMRHDVGKLVVSSTAAVFGEPEFTPITEDAPMRPTNPYGEAKCMLERTVAWVERCHGLRWATLRYFNAAGAEVGGTRGEDHRPETHLIPIVLSVAAGQRETVTLFGSDYATADGSCVRDYVHVCDLAEAHLAALAALDEHPHLALNLGTGVGSSVREVIDCARQVTGHPIPVVEAARRPGDPAILVASGERAQSVLAWQAKHDLHSIIETAWQWHASHPSGYAD